MKIKGSPSFSFKIYLAGDYDMARDILKKYCNDNPSCFTITKTSYIYNGGEEFGIIVGLENYPRFEKTVDELYKIAFEIAHLLREGLYQTSCLVVGPTESVWFSTRKEDN